MSPKQFWKLNSIMIYRSIILISTFLLSLYPAFAQDKDSLIFVNQKFNKTELAEGAYYYNLHFKDNSLFGTNQFISVLELNPTKRKIEIYASPLLKETSLMCKEQGAIAGINGSFFSFNYNYNTENYNSVDFIRKNGIDISPNTFKAKANREMHQKGCIAIDNNKLYILKADVLTDWEKLIQAKEVITTGPLLFKDLQKEPLLNSSFYTSRHPRTVVGVKKNGLVLLITIDGRSQESAGMTIAELQKIMLWFGCIDAINLDGGGSTTMYIKNMSENGVVNHPSDNKKFDTYGERKVANSIIVF